MSGPLVPSSSGGFAQQGQIDWVAFSKHTISFSVELLARWSKAGIDPLTIATGRAIGHIFVLPPETQQRLDEALSRLETFLAFGKVLSFGFGIRHVVDHLRDTEQGSALVILCASLSSFYPTFYCAQVLRELCKASEAPQELTPALSQWVALIDVCSGVLAKTNFLMLVRGLERYICPNWSHAYRGEVGQLPADAGVLAKALINLARISNGDMMSVNFTGGLDCAWIAGVAQWMLGLTVHIIDEPGVLIYEGNMLPSQRTSSERPQVTIILCSEGQRQRTASTLNIQQKVFIIPKGGTIFAMGQPTLAQPTLDPDQNSVAQVSEWSHILADTFGSTTKALLEPISLFGRLLAAVALCAEQPHCISRPYGVDVEHKLRSPWNYPLWIHPRSKGCAFLHFAAEQLPELRPCVTSALSSYPQDGRDDDGLSISSLLEQLQTKCTCSNCAFRTGIPSMLTPCLEKLAEVIICYLWLLVPATIDKSILPSISGLSRIFRLLSRERNKMPIFSIWKSRCEMNVCGRDGVSEQIPTLFGALTGRTMPSRVSVTTSAVAANGLCIYHKSFSQLEGLPSDMCSLSVIPGHIAHQNQIFRQVTDLTSHVHQWTHAREQAEGNDGNYDLLIQETEHSDRLEAAFITYYSDSIVSLRLLPLYGLAQVINRRFFPTDFRVCDLEKHLGDDTMVSWSLLSSARENSGFGVTCRSSVEDYDSWIIVTWKQQTESEFTATIRHLEAPRLYFLLNSLHMTTGGRWDPSSSSHPLLLQSCGCLICALDIMNDDTPRNALRSVMFKGLEPGAILQNNTVKVIVHPLQGQPLLFDFKLEVKAGSQGRMVDQKICEQLTDSTIDPTTDSTIYSTTDSTIDSTTDPTTNSMIDPAIDLTIDPTTHPTTD